MATDILKRCTQCGETKPGTQFSPRTKNKDGLYSWCKTCSAARAKAWALQNKERVSERNKAKYWADPEAARAQRTAYYRAKTGGGPAKVAQAPMTGPDGSLTLCCTKCGQRKPLDAFYRRNGKPRVDCKACFNERGKSYVAKNQDKILAYKKLWTKKNSERVSSVKRKRYAEDAAVRAAKLAKAREWREQNPEKRSAIAQNYKHRRRAQEEGGVASADLLKWKRAQRKVCHWCRTACPDNFHIDHIRPLARGGQHILANLCISCPTCNIRKGARDPIEFAQSLGLLL